MGISKYLSICTWNSRGTSASIPYIRELVQTYDIVLLNEHWLHDNRLSFFEEINPDISYFARASNTSGAESYGSTRGDGGLAILWRNDLKGITPLREILHDRICGIRIQIDDITVNIYSVYMPSKGCRGDLCTTLDELATIIEGNEVGCINVIGGDFNGDVGVLGGPRGLRVPNYEGKKVFQFAESFKFIFANLMPTATGPVNTHHGPTGSTCIDYFLIPEHIKDNVMECKTWCEHPLNTSDHDPISISLDIGKIERQSVLIDATRSVRWSKISKDDLRDNYTTPVTNDLQSVLDKLTFGTHGKDDLDKLIGEVVQILKAHEKNLPKAKFRRNVKPYWSDELSKLKKEKVRCFGIWKQAGRPREKDNVLRVSHIQAEKNFRRKLRELCKKYENDKIEDIIKSAEVNKDQFWKMLKKERSGGKVTISTIMNNKQKVVSEPEEILEVWREHFDKLSTPKNLPEYDGQHFRKVSDDVKKWMGQNDTDDFLNNNFTYKEIEKGITKLHSGKVPGYDFITKENICAAGPVLMKLLLYIFNEVLRLEYIPINFRRGIQIPLYKGKNAPPLDTNSYRGITLLSTLNKLFEVIVWQRMEQWWNDHEVISRLQGACRKGVSCIHTAMLLQEIVATQLESHNKVFVAYYDVAKAFDGVWVDGLFYRLREMGIKGKTWRLFIKLMSDLNARLGSKICTLTGMTWSAEFIKEVISP